ncbi:MAG: HPr(Ser) kinase/phosphatase [Oscillospiraceae bacterium]|nr:HPr(Ser) kinase/phosphatase [Oscillospiraceae bacterium]
MTEAPYRVKLTDFIKEFNLTVLHEPPHIADIEITTDDVNRPGLQLTGFFDYFEPSRLQIMGKVEATYLETLTPKQRRENFDALFSRKIPALIVSRGIEPCSECLASAKKYEVPLLQTQESTAYIMSAMVASLKVSLAPRVTRHGVLVEVYGEGILLFGESGVGKSETAIELVKRGHRLIADDAVEIKRVSAISLVGSAPELIRHYIELRGIGVVDVRRIFGMGAVNQSEKIDLVIHLEMWDDKKQYDRLGLDQMTTEILGVEIPKLEVPVKPGRNLAIIIEVAAMNLRHKKLGYNAAKEFTDRISRHFGQDGSDDWGQSS